MEFEQFYDDQNYILGNGLKRFEKEYASFSDVNYAVGTGNGHDALLIILKSLGIEQGDEVILPAHTFIATVLSIINAGATPVLVDVDEHTFNIDSKEIEDKITDKTKAIVPVHLYGNPCDLDAIQAIAIKYKLHVIEDNAQAQGAEYKGRKTGSLGILNFTSFYPTKNIGALGDGGMITTNSKELAEKTLAIRNYGKSMKDGYNLPGINSRLDELQARLLSVKLKYLKDWNVERIEIAEWYESQLKGINEIRLQTAESNSRNVRHIFPILTKKRDELRSYLYSKGIDTLIHYKKPIHLHEAFSRYKKGSFPIAEHICDTELSLPIYPGLKEEEIFFICDQIKEFLLKS